MHQSHLLQHTLRLGPAGGGRDWPEVELVQGLFPSSTGDSQDLLRSSRSDRKSSVAFTVSNILSARIFLPRINLEKSHEGYCHPLPLSETWIVSRWDLAPHPDIGRHSPGTTSINYVELIKPISITWTSTIKTFLTRPELVEIPVWSVFLELLQNIELTRREELISWRLFSGDCLLSLFYILWLDKIMRARQSTGTRSKNMK